MNLIQDFKLVKDLVYSITNSSNQNGHGKSYWYYKPNKQTIYKLRHGVWDSAVIMETWWLKEYSRHYQQMDTEKEIIILDVGAHIGSFSINMASQFKNAKIYAFEPHPQSFSLLKENIKLNKLEGKILPFELAISGSDQKKENLKIHGGNFASHSLFQNGQRVSACSNSNVIEVKTITLSEVFRKHKIKKCYLLKMDCEGCEYPVLSSLPKISMEKIDKLIFEYHCQSRISKLKKELEETGFKTKFDRAISNPFFGWVVKAPILVCWR